MEINKTFSIKVRVAEVGGCDKCVFCGSTGCNRPDGEEFECSALVRPDHKGVAFVIEEVTL